MRCEVHHISLVRVGRASVRHGDGIDTATTRAAGVVLAACAASMRRALLSVSTVSRSILPLELARVGRGCAAATCEKTSRPPRCVRSCSRAVWVVGVRPKVLTDDGVSGAMLRCSPGPSKRRGRRPGDL